ncbi:MAG: glycosyltransferase family 2 protein [Casimicrobiaceae bacterium]
MASIPPAVTAIIPTYNWCSVLPHAIASVLGQTFTDFELLVIGDGCTDGSESVVTSVADPRVRWIGLPVNAGHQSGPNNEGLRQARGNLIAYLGHDDLWMPHHLECLVGAIRAGADLAYGITAMIGPEGRYAEMLPLGSCYRPGDWLPPSCVVHRHEMTEAIGGWRHARDLDTDPERELWNRAHTAGQRMSFVPHLTTVKFPALWRRNAYRERPSHEQAAWLQRMRTEPGIETAELARLRSSTQPLPIERLKRAWRRLTIGSPLLRPRRKGALHARRRYFKGLDDAGSA